MATKISDNGFFSDEAIQKSDAIKQQYKQLFFYLAEVNEQAHRYLGLWQTGSINLRRLNLRQVFSAALFYRALTAYQALTLLSQRGFASEVRATCRSILEAKFKLAYLLLEPEAAVLLIAKGEERRADRLRNMKSGELPVPQELSNYDWDSAIRKAEEHLKDAKGSKRRLPSLKNIAKKTGLERDYLGAYSFFSEATHAGHIELETYVKFSSGPTPTATFMYGPDSQLIGWVSLEGAGFLLDCIEISARIFRIRSSRDFELLFKPILRRNDEMIQRYRDLFLKQAGPGHPIGYPVTEQTRS